MDFKNIVCKIRTNNPFALISQQRSIEDTVVDSDSVNYKEDVGAENNANNGEDSKVQDLMRLVGNAIDEWAKLYQMENLPKKIIFQQALTILNAMNKLVYTSHRKGAKKMG